MAKKIVKRFLPDPKKILENKHLQILGSIIHSPNLWHLNRYSVSSALSIGIFVAFIPLPFQMLIAATGAILFKANLPISVALVWITNPFTMPPLFYFCYRLGSFLLGRKPQPWHLEISFEWLIDEFHHFGVPLFVGSIVVGTFLALLLNFFARMFWRYTISKAWRERKEKRSRLKMKKQKNKF